MTCTIKLRHLFACFLFTTFLFAPSLTYEVEEDTGSYLLTELDFQNAISENQYLLVNFHALWCRYSKAFKSEWKALSDSLKSANSPVKLAKVEAYDEKNLAKEYRIEGFPTLKLFIDGVPYNYEGERIATHILEFINRKLKNSLSVVNDRNTIENKLKEYEWVGVSISDTDNDAVKSIASDMQDVLFVRISTQQGRNLYGDTSNTPFILVNNITGSHDNFQGEITRDGLFDFINSKKFPPVARISKGTIEKMFLSEEPVLILVRRDAGDDYAEKAFNDARANAALKGIFMAVANTKDDVSSLLAANLALEPHDLPAVVIMRADREKIRKYKLEGSITTDSIVRFFADYKAQKAKRIYLSEPIPEKNDDLVKKVVTKSFSDMVLDSKKDVLLLVWVPWSGHSRAMMPTYDNVARKTREVSNFLVAKIDASENDLEGFGLDIVEYPTILLFQREDKENPIEFNDERNEYAFDTFIKTYATVGLSKMKKPDPMDKNEL